MRQFILSLSMLVIVTGCVHRTHPPTTQPIAASLAPASLEEAMLLIDHREDWKTLPSMNLARHPAEKYLKDLTIVIDPGHGGTDGGAVDSRTDYKRGPTGVREADMNFRVAQLLERLLKEAGVNVILTRYGDDTIGLKERAEVANTAVRVDGKIGADLFISIHHNAAGPKPNYTTVWYHGQVDDAEASLDPAIHVAHHLSDAIHTDEAVTAPVLSDELMYPHSGFGVLRALTVPGFLCECSFFTHPAEEQRLRDAVYNLREAYGIYIGLCEYAYDGRPTQTLPEVALGSENVTITTTLNEGLPPWWGKDRSRILSSTVQLRFEGKTVASDFDPESKKLTAVLPISSQKARLRNQPIVFELHFANMFKHHNYPQRFEITIDPSGPKARVTALGPAPISTTKPSTAPTSGSITGAGSTRPTR